MGRKSRKTKGLSPQKAAREDLRRRERFEKRRGGHDRPKIDYQRRKLALVALGFNAYQHYLDSDLWKGIRKRVLERDKRTCRLCGGPAHQVHHNSYSPETLRGDDISGLAAICNPCHTAIERTADGAKRKGDQVSKEYARKERLARARSPTPAPPPREFSPEELAAFATTEARLAQRKLPRAPRPAHPPPKLSAKKLANIEKFKKMRAEKKAQKRAKRLSRRLGEQADPLTAEFLAIVAE